MLSGVMTQLVDRCRAELSGESVSSRSLFVTKSLLSRLRGNLSRSFLTSRL